MKRLGWGLLLGLSLNGWALAAPDYDGAAKRSRELLEKMVAADTTNPPGNEARIVQIVSARLKQEGIPFEVTTFGPGRENLIARLKGNGQARPILLIAHIDVVGTASQEWSIPNPHQVTEREGFLYGRGVSDDLGMAATLVETLILLKQNPVSLRRDVIVALTGDEESGGAGIRQVLRERPELVDAEFAFNEGGGFTLGNDDKMKYLGLQVGEKIYEDFVVTAKGATGHSSVPLKDNAIYRLARALEKFEKYKFPIRVLPAVRSYLTERARLESEPLAGAMRQLASEKKKAPANALKVIESDLAFSTLLRTTCVATMLSGGTKENALPPTATVNINCRILPDETPEQVQRQLAAVFQDPTLEIKSRENSGASPASPVSGAAVESIERVTHRLYPELPILPSISRGATDSRFLRAHGILAYGINPMPLREGDSKRAHGVDERIPVGALRAGVEYLDLLVRDLAGASASH